MTCALKLHDIQLHDIKIMFNNKFILEKLMLLWYK